MVAVALAWVVFAGASAGLLLFSFSFVAWYSDRSETAKLSKSIGTFSLFFALLASFLIPVDIFTVSFDTDSSTGAQLDPIQTYNNGHSVRSLYCVLYAVLALFSFFILPFGYFFYEEEGDDRTVGEQARVACRYMIAFVLVFVALALIGIFSLRDKGHTQQKWINRLQDDFTDVEGVLAFVVGCLVTVGLIGWATYTAYGLAALPFSSSSGNGRRKLQYKQPSQRLRGSDDAASRGRLAQIGAKIEYLTARYASAHDSDWSREDRIEIDKLRSEERQLLGVNAEHRSADVKSTEESASCRGCFRVFGRCLWASTIPIRLVLSLITGTLSLTIAASILLTTVDKAIHSPCKASCGFAIEASQLLNPLNAILTHASKMFPIDYVLFGGVILYLFLCTLVGLVDLDVRVFCFRFYAIRRGRTMQNGLLMGIWFVTFVLLAINAQVMTLAPQYGTFGDQQIPRAGKLIACSAGFAGSNDEASKSCVMTQFSKFFNVLVSEFPLFGNFIYFSNYIFLLVYFGSLSTAVARRFSTKRDDETAEEALDYLIP